MKTTLIATILAIMMLPFAAATNWVLPNGGSFSSVGGGSYALSDDCYGGHCVVADTDTSGSDYEASATIELLGGLVGNEAGICARMNSQGFGYCYSLSWGGSTQTNQYTMLGHFWPQKINNVYTYNPADLQPGTGVNALPGNVYNIKIKTQGNTLYGKAWPQGSSEPSSWNAVHTDTQNRYSSGSLGFYTYYTQAKIGNMQINNNPLPEPVQSCPSAPDMKIYPTTQSIAPGGSAGYKVVIKNNNPFSCSDKSSNLFWFELLAPDTNTNSPTANQWTHTLNGQRGKTDGMLMKWYDLYIPPQSQQTYNLELKAPLTATGAKHQLGFTARPQANTDLRSQYPLIGYVEVLGTGVIPREPIVEEPSENCYKISTKDAEPSYFIKNGVQHSVSINDATKDSCALNVDGSDVWVIAKGKSNPTLANGLNIKVKETMVDEVSPYHKSCYVCFDVAKFVPLPVVPTPGVAEPEPGIALPAPGPAISPEEPTAQQTSSCDNGCRVNSHCLPFGTRLVQEDKPVYCGITQQLNEQQAEGASCQNDYECSSNSCASGKCVDLAAKIEKQQGVLNKILHFLSTIFGKRIESTTAEE